MDFSAIILAAGFSERMMQPKALLPFNRENCFLEQIISEYNKADITKIVVVVNNKNISRIKNSRLKYLSQCNIIVNQNLKADRIYSIQTGLKALANCDFVFIQDTDNPFITSDIIRQMIQEADENHYLSPCYNGIDGHPVVLSKKIAEHIKQLNAYNQKLSEILTFFKQKRIEIENAAILININTLEDYRKYFR